MTKILLISLENCPYSEAAKEMLDNYKIKYKYILVNNITKIKYKTKEVKTFPQIYYLKRDEKHLIGGFDDLKFIIDIINDSYDNPKNINKIVKKYKTWNRKDVLRLVTLFTV